jgi:hypothetical protein
MSMILKRAATPSADVKPSTPATPPHHDSPSSNKKARTTTPKAKSTPSNVVSPSSVRSDGKTARATFAMMVIEAGIKAVNKAEVEAAVSGRLSANGEWRVVAGSTLADEVHQTGLTAQQQKDMTRQGKGALRNALMERAGTL